MDTENKNRHPLLKILLLDIGVVGTSIFGAIAIIAIVFIALNYFNILSLSDLYPKYLSLLPHRQTSLPHQQSTQTPTKPILPQQNKSVANFQYDAVKAQKLLSQYLKENIKPEFLPEKIEVKQHLIASGELKGTDYEFGANWTIGKTFFQSNFHYQIKTSNLNDMEFSIQLQDVKDLVANEQLTQELATRYLRETQASAKFDCGTFKDTVSFCEKFLTTSVSKMGLGLAIGKNTPKNIVFVFSCFIPKESLDFNKRTSCLLLRQK